MKPKIRPQIVEYRVRVNGKWLPAHVSGLTKRKRKQATGKYASNPRLTQAGPGPRPMAEIAPPSTKPTRSQRRATRAAESYEFLLDDAILKAMTKE